MVLGAFNCADESHQKVCGDFGITGFPTLKVKFALAGWCGAGGKQSLACLPGVSASACVTSHT